VILALLLLAGPLDLAQYRARLQEIDDLLARGDPAAAARQARSLEGSAIRAGGEELAADEWVLGPIARQKPQRARLRSLIEALAPPPATRQTPDLALLENLRREQGPVRPAAGGEIEPIDAPGASLQERLLHLVDETARSIGRQLSRFFRWLASFFPTGPMSAPEQDGGHVLVPILLGVGAILAGVVLLALLSFRAGPPQGPRSIGRERPGADEDPLSRTSIGWEERARELAREGRSREAIRAWYHAVLVRCAAQGLLHHRPGRTNWEYAHALPPALPWRGRFEDLTFRFDQEWYGRAESTGEALAVFADGAAEILRALGQRA
jgi:Domain of unknown function (DUF4129)